MTDETAQMTEEEREIAELEKAASAVSQDPLGSIESDPEPEDAPEPEAPAEGDDQGSSDAMAAIERALGRGEGPKLPADDDLEGWRKRAMEKEEQAAGTTAALRQEREMRQRLEGRVDRIMQLLESQAPAEATPEEPDIPDPTEDIVGHLVGRIKGEIGETLQPVLTAQQQAEQQRRVQEAYTQVTAHVNADRQQFIEQGVDVEAAEAFVNKTVTDQLTKVYEMRGFSPQEARVQADRELGELAARAYMQSYQGGQSYTRTLLEQAMGLGWKPGANGAAAPPAEKPRSSEAQHVARNLAQSGAEPERAMGGGGHGITREALLTGDDDEFDRAARELEKKLGKRAAQLELNRIALGRG